MGSAAVNVADEQNRSLCIFRHCHVDDIAALDVLIAGNRQVQNRLARGRVAQRVNLRHVAGNDGDIRVLLCVFLLIAVCSHSVFGSPYVVRFWFG